jgi:hypothetical protein
MADDRLTAALDEIRADWERIGGKPVRHIPRLIAAIEAVLALVDDWKAVPGPGPCHYAAEMIELAISAALLGEAPDGT